MSTRVSTKRATLGVLAFFVGVCVAVVPAEKPATPMPSPSAQTSTPLKQLLTPVKSEIPPLLRNPSAAKSVKPAWYKGKKILNPRELSFLLYQAGFRGKAHRLAWIVAMGESTGRPGSLNSSGCYGLFQINMSGSLKADRLERYGLESVSDLFNPLTNARVAFRMSHQGKTWTAWTVNPHARSGEGYPGIVRHLPKS